MDKQFILNWEEVEPIREAIFEYICKHQWFEDERPDCIQHNLDVLHKVDKRLTEHYLKYYND